MISKQIQAAKDNKNKIKITAGLYMVTHDSAKFSKVFLMSNAHMRKLTE